MFSELNELRSRRRPKTIESFSRALILKRARRRHGDWWARRRVFLQWQDAASRASKARVSGQKKWHSARHYYIHTACESGLSASEGMALWDLLPKDGKLAIEEEASNAARGRPPCEPSTVGDSPSPVAPPEHGPFGGKEEHMICDPEELLTYVRASKERGGCDFTWRGCEKEAAAGNAPARPLSNAASPAVSSQQIPGDGRRRHRLAGDFARRIEDGISRATKSKVGDQDFPLIALCTEDPVKDHVASERLFFHVAAIWKRPSTAVLLRLDRESVPGNEKVRLRPRFQEVCFLDDLLFSWDGYFSPENK